MKIFKVIDQFVSSVLKYYQNFDKSFINPHRDKKENTCLHVSGTAVIVRNDQLLIQDLS